MLKSLAFFFAVFFVFFGCSKKTGDSGAVAVPLPGLGISIYVPEGMEAAAPAQMQELQAAMADIPPILPFADIPCYQFSNPTSGTALLVSQLSLVDPAAEKLDPVTLMEEYRKHLEKYYQTDAIAANEMVRGDFRLMIMNFLYEPGNMYITKVLYHRYPQQYFMVDLFIPGDTTPKQEEAQQLENLFLSVQPIKEP
jgi:hypothetical protein